MDEDKAMEKMRQHVEENREAYQKMGTVDTEGQCQEGDMDVKPNHGTATVATPDGGRDTVRTCEVSSEDINEDGTVSTPVTGTCECHTEAQCHVTDINLELGNGEEIPIKDVEIEHDSDLEGRDTGMQPQQLEYEGSMTFEIEDIGTAFMIGMFFGLTVEE